jgi:hypothetical protein
MQHVCDTSDVNRQLISLCIHYCRNSRHSPETFTIIPCSLCGTASAQFRVLFVCLRDG